MFKPFWACTHVNRASVSAMVPVACETTPSSLERRATTLESRAEDVPAAMPGCVEAAPHVRALHRSVVEDEATVNPSPRSGSSSKSSTGSTSTDHSQTSYPDVTYFSESERRCGRARKAPKHLQVC